MQEVGLTNNYVEQICKKLFGNTFLGVYPCDIHPNIRRKNFSIVFNTGDSSTSGEHFVCLYTNSSTLFYFDSFGKEPTDKNIQSFIRKQKHGRRFVYWKKNIQHSLSGYCGFYVIGYLIHKNWNVKTFTRIFSKDLLKNDTIIVNFIIKCLK